MILVLYELSVYTPLVVLYHYCNSSIVIFSKIYYASIINIHYGVLRNNNVDEK